MVALDTEMNQLHCLAIEQGPFFKTVLPGAFSDSDRYNLKEHATRQSPHASHLNRKYWKGTIFVSEISNIRIKTDQMIKIWTPIFTALYALHVKPEKPDTRKWNPVQETTLFDFHMNFYELMKSIIEICQYIERRHLEKSSVRQKRSLSPGREVLLQPMSAPLDGLLEQLKTKM